MNDAGLGRLEPVALREVWANEATDFTPWLAENLHLLGGALGMELELEGREQDVGPFRADLLCRDIQTDTRVVIENQLGRTDHNHLGQLLTYAAGLEAASLVWIAPEFTEEHRAVLDWLNGITEEKFSFFGVVIELWRIEGSKPAPHFTVVAKPNDWSRSVRAAARAMAAGELTELHLTYQEYWQGLLEELRHARSPLSTARKPSRDSWLGWGIGRSDAWLGARLQRRKRKIMVQLILAGPEPDLMFAALQARRDQIERKIGVPLEWDAQPGRKQCNITASLADADPEDRADWPRQHAWLVDMLGRFHRVFPKYLRALDMDELAAEAGEEGREPDDS